MSWSSGDLCTGAMVMLEQVTDNHPIIRIQFIKALWCKMCEQSEIKTVTGLNITEHNLMKSSE